MIKLPAIYKDDPRRVLVLASARNTEAGRMFLEAVEVLRDQARVELDENPNVSDRGREDFRYYLGIVEGLRRVLALEGKAAAILQK